MTPRRGVPWPVETGVLELTLSKGEGERLPVEEVLPSLGRDVEVSLEQV